MIPRHSCDNASVANKENTALRVLMSPPVEVSFDTCLMRQCTRELLLSGTLPGLSSITMDDVNANELLAVNNSVQSQSLCLISGIIHYTDVNYIY